MRKTHRSSIRRRLNPAEHCPECGALWAETEGLWLCPHCGFESQAEDEPAEVRWPALRPRSLPARAA